MMTPSPGRTSRTTEGDNIMKIGTTLRRSIAALALGAVSIGGLAVATSSSAGALALPPPRILSNLVVSNVTVYDHDAHDRAASLPPAPAGGFANPDYTWNPL